jgi:hypothetical protein
VKLADTYVCSATFPGATVTWHLDYREPASFPSQEWAG